jgi:hypothetical protein
MQQGRQDDPCTTADEVSMDYRETFEQALD